MSDALQNTLGRLGITADGNGNIKITGALTAAGGVVSNGNAQCTSTLSQASTTAVAAIPGLSVNVAAAGVYNFRAHLSGTSGVSGGIKVTTGASTATMTTFNATALNFNGTTINANTTVSSFSSSLTAATAVYTDVFIEGSFTVNAAGTFALSMAQNASNSTATTVIAGSFMTVSRVS